MNNKEDSTKSVFLKKALILFSEKGYDGVTVQDIAKAVGVTAPALYKHYKGKRELFDAIIDESRKSHDETLTMYKGDFKHNLDQARFFLESTEEEEIENIKEMFCHLLHDEYAVAFRKLMVVEQYKMPELAELLNQRYIYSQFDQHEALFKFLMGEGALKQGADPRALAVTFVSPIQLLLSVCDREPDKEQWALETIEQHIRTFNKMYRIK